MKMAILCLKLLLVVIALGWAYWTLRGLVIFAKVGRALELASGIPSNGPTNSFTENFWATVQFALTSLGPLALALVFLFIRWPESVLVKREKK